MTSASALRQPLERLYREFDYGARLGRDAIQFPLRYVDAADRELVSLLTCCLAYGRVDLFGRALDRALGVMGPSPAAFVREFDPRRQARVFDGFLYRFNRPRDLVAFCVAARDVLARHGTLEKCFLAGDPERTGPIGPPLTRFARAFLEADVRDVFPRGRRSRGYRHLFPLPSAGGPCKRLLLFMRWMVRREPPDFGLWSAVSPARLLMPVDTHVENMSRAIGLTRRRSRNWKMAEEITARLAAVDPADPVKYDFALCHKRMSGDCLDRRDATVCAPCRLRAVCRHWRRRGIAGIAGIAEPPLPHRRATAPAASPSATTASAATPASLRPPTPAPDAALRYR
ncbi:MAG TPA: TIGR02757 family protein [Methylomirabilota bacterium]